MKNRFAFGKNWRNYLEHSFTPEAYERAEESLKHFLKGESLEGKTFLDVGCGSGIHSLAACRLGAKKVVSIDYDPDSVSCAKSLSEKEVCDWEVKEGSMLEESFMRSLGSFDIVYCWGVAHHTGDMWTALKNLMLNVNENGLLIVAIYNTLEGGLGSRWWLRVKRIYTYSPRFVQILMEHAYFILHFFRMVLHFKNPFTVINHYKKKRGMSYKHDLVDWLGGYPYEHARAEEIFNFFHDQNMELINVKTTNFLGNNQFLFRKK